MNYPLNQTTKAPEGVEHAVHGKLIDDTSDCIATSIRNSLTVYIIKNNKLEQIVHEELQANIEGLTVITAEHMSPTSPAGTVHSYLVLVFPLAKISIMKFNQDTNSFEIKSLHYYEKLERRLKEKNIPTTTTPPRLIVEKQGRLGLLIAYDRLFWALPFQKANGTYDDNFTSFDLDLYEFGVIHIIDICFLEGFKTPTFAVLHTSIPSCTGRIANTTEETNEVIFFQVNMYDRNTEESDMVRCIFRKKGIPYNAFQMLPCEPLPGVLVLTTTSVFYITHTVGKQFVLKYNNYFNPPLPQKGIKSNIKVIEPESGILITRPLHKCIKIYPNLYILFERNGASYYIHLKIFNEHVVDMFLTMSPYKFVPTDMFVFGKFLFVGSVYHESMLFTAAKAVYSSGQDPFDGINEKARANMARFFQRIEYDKKLVHSMNKSHEEKKPEGELLVPIDGYEFEMVGEYPRAFTVNEISVKLPPLDVIYTLTNIKDYCMNVFSMNGEVMPEVVTLSSIHGFSKLHHIRRNIVAKNRYVLAMKNAACGILYSGDLIVATENSVSVLEKNTSDETQMTSEPQKMEMENDNPDDHNSFKSEKTTGTDTRKPVPEYFENAFYSSIEMTNVKIVHECVDQGIIAIVTTNQIFITEKKDRQITIITTLDIPEMNKIKCRGKYICGSQEKEIHLFEIRNKQAEKIELADGHNLPDMACNCFCFVENSDGSISYIAFVFGDSLHLFSIASRSVQMIIHNLFEGPILQSVPVPTIDLEIDSDDTIPEDVMQKNQPKGHEIPNKQKNEIINVELFNCAGNNCLLFVSTCGEFFFYKQHHFNKGRDIVHKSFQRVPLDTVFMFNPKRLSIIPNISHHSVSRKDGLNDTERKDIISVAGESPFFIFFRHGAPLIHQFHSSQPVNSVSLATMRIRKRVNEDTIKQSIKTMITCSNEFGVTIATLPKKVYCDRLTRPFTVTPLPHSPHIVRHTPQCLLVVLTSEELLTTKDTPPQLPKVSNQQIIVSEPEELVAKPSLSSMYYRESKLYFYENNRLYPSNLLFKEGRLITAVSSMNLRINDTMHPLIGIGVSVILNEDTPVRGKVGLYEIIRGEKELYLHKQSKPVKDGKTPIITILDIDGYLAVGGGFMLELYRSLGDDRWEVKDNSETYSFLRNVNYLQLSLRNDEGDDENIYLITLADYYKSTQLLLWRPEKTDTHKENIVPLARDRRNISCVDAIFVPTARYFNILVADSRTNMYYMTYTKADEGRITILTTSAGVSINQHAIRYTRVKKMRSEEYEYLYVTSEGTIGVVSTIDEKTYRALMTVQFKMFKEIEFFAGTNPEEFRSEKKVEVYSGAKFNPFLDVNVLSMYFSMGMEKKRECAGRIYSTLELEGIIKRLKSG